VQRAPFAFHVLKGSREPAANVDCSGAFSFFSILRNLIKGVYSGFFKLQGKRAK
jgi:hypothetical protein